MAHTTHSSFYQLLQLSPTALWAAVRTAQGPERTRLVFAMAVRSLLLVAFAILFIGGLTPVFGTENSCLVVGGFCMLLGIKFVSFGYNAKDSVLALALVLALTVAGGQVTALGMPWLSFAANLVFLGIILLLVAQDPRMGNAGTYVFAYVFVSQTPVTGQALGLRWMLAGMLLLLCAGVLVHKHLHAHAQVRLGDVLRASSFKNPETRWRLRMAIAVALVLLAGDLLQVPRSLWMGYACMSVLLPYDPEGNKATTTLRRGLQRAGGVLAGSALYWLLAAIVPPEAHSLFGPIAGLCIGFSAHYFWNNVLNCFGALLLASALYGAAGSALLRVGDNLLGILFALACALLWSWMDSWHAAQAQKER